MRSFNFGSQRRWHCSTISLGSTAIALSMGCLTNSAMHNRKDDLISVSVITLLVVAIYATIFGVYRVNLAIAMHRAKLDSVL